MALGPQSILYGDMDPRSPRSQPYVTQHKKHLEPFDDTLVEPPSILAQGPSGLRISMEVKLILCILQYRNYKEALNSKPYRKYITNPTVHFFY